MTTLPFSFFRKSAICPASQTLLAYRQSRLPMIEQARVDAHLTYCEFCSAELQLLDRYRFGAEEIALAEIPAQLRRLAEKVLRNTRMRVGAAVEVPENPQLSN